MGSRNRVTLPQLPPHLEAQSLPQEVDIVPSVKPGILLSSLAMAVPASGTAAAVDN